MDYNDILCEEDQGIFRIVFNRPESMNSFTNSLTDEFLNALEYAAKKQDVKVIIIAGSGRAFSAGGDIKYLAAGLDVLSGRDYVEKIGGIVKLISDMEKPVIAEVNGFAVGSGCNVALACDIVIASDKARFGQGFLQIGFAPDGGGSYLLPRLVGLRKAKELVLTGKMLDAEEAEKIGLINKVVKPEELETTVKEMAVQFANGPTRAIGFSKLLLNRSSALDLNDALASEAYIQAICMQTNDHKEGIQAFLAKRPPVFTGN